MMTTVQHELLELLKEIDGICRKYDIEYYLGGGTFIGAVRHGGFLPWDDDVDIHMSRANAKKFVAAVKEENRPDRFLYTCSEDGKKTLAHWRYENTNTTAFMRHLVGTSDPKGQFVDVMVNYPLPRDEKRIKRCFERFKLYCELKNSNFIWNSPAWVSVRTKGYLKRYRFMLKVEKLMGRETLQNHLRKKICEYPEEGATEWMVWSPGMPTLRQPKAFWGKPRYVPFEDTVLPVAEQAEKLLCHTYGPLWFEVPAYEEQENHVFVMDMDIPYNVYVQDINKRFNTQGFLAKEISKKRYWLGMWDDRAYVNPYVRKLQGLRTSLELQKNVVDSGMDLTTLIARRQEKDVSTLTHQYSSQVNLKANQYWSVYLDMPDKYLYAALYFMCFDGNYGLARKVLRQRRTCVERELSPDLRRLCDICDATDELLMARYADQDMERTRELVDEWLMKEPTALYFQRADMDLRLSYDRRGESAEELLRRCEGYLEQYPEDGELLKYKGDILLELGEKDQGEKCYKIARCSLKNGFCIKAIKSYYKDSEMTQRIERGL